MSATVELGLPVSPSAVEVSVLCARFGRGDVAHVVCDAAQLGADLAAVAALARVALAARRGGAAVHVRNASPGLRSLLELVGLGETLPDLSEPTTGAARPRRCHDLAPLRTVSAAPSVPSSRETS